MQGLAEQSGQENNDDIVPTDGRHEITADIKPLSEADIHSILQERAQRFRQAGVIEDEDLQEMIVFTQAGTQYAVSLGMLTEIRTITKLTLLPMVSKSILGVINVRGRIVALYGLTADNNDSVKNGFALVGYGIAAHLAIWADDIIGTIRVTTADIKSPPISLNDRDYIRGVGSDGMVYLDLDKLVNNQKLYMA